MTRFATLAAAASLTLGALVFIGCQGEDYNRDNSGNAQTSSDVYTHTSSSDSASYNGSMSSSDNHTNEEPGRGLSSSNMETHGGPSRITGGENVDHHGIGVTGGVSAGSPSGSVDTSGQRLSGSADVSVPSTQPSDAVPTTQPSVEISR